MATRARQSAEARERIVQAAAELIHRDGVAGASVGAILARAGAGKGQLYHYFDDKRDLVHAAEAHQAETIIAPQVEQLASVATLADLRHWADGVVRWHRDAGTPGCPVGSLASHLGSDERLSRRLDRTLSAWVDAIEAAIDRLEGAGELPPGDSAARALLLATAIQGGALLARAHGDVGPLSTAVDAALAAVGGGSP